LLLKYCSGRRRGATAVPPSPLNLTAKLASLAVMFYDACMTRAYDGAVHDFAQAIGSLVRRIRAASSAHDLSWTESAVMARLSKQGPATTAELARSEGVKPQSMGTVIAGLEEMGFIERRPHPTDGRQVNIQLSAKGEAVRRSAKDARRTWLAQAIARLDEEERKQLFAAGDIIRRLTET
jgi:DNA-binding MarR family transcriptional regulator